MPGPPKLILNEGGVFPPQGLLYLATYLKKFSRHEVKILDCIAEALDYAGVETRLALIYTYGVMTGKLSLNELVALTSTNAAKLFGLFPRKGTIAPGSDADLVVWDPQASSTITVETLHQQVDYTPYEGFAQKGQALHVFLRGKQVVKDGQLQVTTPTGIYLSRKPFLKRKVGGNV